MKTVFEFPFVNPGLNGSKGMIRSNRFALKKIKDRTFRTMFEQWDKKRFSGPVKITYIRCSVKLMDERDNLPSSQKYFLDSLVKLTIIKDDSPRIISDDSETLQKKVSTYKDVKTIVIVESV
jgi:hypothetical protein